MARQKKLVDGTGIELYDQAPWNRATVADGKWLQSETLDPISANDRILASAIDYVSGGVDNLSARIDLLEDATDVINVYGNWNDFINNSADLFDTSAITDNDIIKVLNDKNSYPNELFPDAEELTSGHQTYFRWTVTAQDPHKPIIPSEGEWNYIGYLDPYYNTSEIDDKIEDLSATVKDEYVPWTATDCPIGDKNIANNYSFAQGSANSASYDSFTQGKRNYVNNQSIAAGTDNYAKNQSQALGYTNSATSDSFAAGTNAVATTDAFAQGQAVLADYISMAQGASTSATSTSLAQGKNTSAYYNAFAQGLNGISITASFAQGENPSAHYKSFAQGSEVSANSISLAQGNSAIAKNYSIAQGYNTSANNYSFAQGYNVTAGKTMGCALAQGNDVYVEQNSFGQGSYINSTVNSFAQGVHCSANNGAFAQGANNSAAADAFAQGSGNNAASRSFAQGLKNNAKNNSVAIGNNNSADYQSFAVGIDNIGTYEGFSHGKENESNADSLAQGQGNSATNRSLAQGLNNYANYYSLAQGQGNKAETYSLAQGNANSASTYSQAFGKGIIITNTAMSIGSYNKTSADIAFVIGNGTDDDNRSDLLSINKNGDTTSIGAAYFTGFSGTNISGLTQTASIDNLINSAANGGGMTAVKSISGFTIDNSTGPTQEIELQSSADHLNIALSGGIKNSITLYGQQDAYGSHYLYIQGTELLKTADFDDWATSTASVFSGTSRSAQSAYSATYAYSAQKAASAAIAYSATSAHNAEYFGGKLPSAYMQVANIGRDANGNISSYGGSAIAGLGDYVPKSATDCPIGSNNTAVSYAFAQGTTNSADTTAFAQGDSNKTNTVSFAQGDTNTAANYSLAQGWKSSAERHSMTQGVSNTAYNLSFAQGDLNFADGLSLAQGEQTLARWASIAQGSGTSATNRSQAFGEGTVASASGMAIGTYNKTYDAAFVIGNGTKTNQSTDRSDLLVIDHSGNMIITAVYPTKYCSATYSPSGIHLDDSAPYGYDVYLTNEGVITTGYEGTTPVPLSARWLDIIDPRKDYVSAMGALPIVISAVTRLPSSLEEGIYYLV